MPLGVGLKASADEPSRPADQQGKTERKDRIQAVISKVDAEQDRITVKTTNDQGRKEEETLQLADNAKLLDSDGRRAKLDDSQPGDDVCLTKRNGKAAKIKKHAEAKIAKVDEKNGTITVKMPGKDGKETERTFKLVENAEYLDSQGRVAVLDVFKSGDDVLIIEGEGALQAIKKQDKTGSAARAQ